MYKKHTKNDIYINSLKYGKEKLSNFEDFTKEELREYLLDKGHSISEKSPSHIQNFKDSVFEQLFGRVFDYSQDKNNGTQRFWLNLDGYFRLLDYEKLEDARKSSRQAMWISAFAIAASIETLYVSIHYSNLALNKPIAIKDSQLRELTSAQFDYSKIDKIIELLEFQKNSKKR